MKGKLLDILKFILPCIFISVKAVDTQIEVLKEGKKNNSN